MFPTQINLFSLITLYLGLFLAGLTLFTSVSRMFLNYVNPVTQKDNRFIDALNQAIQNSIEQIIIFLSFFIYELFVVQKSTNLVYLYAIGFTFVIARIIFSVLYAFGSVSGLVLTRVFGFSMNIAIQISLFLDICGVLPLEHLISLIPNLAQYINAL